LGAKSRLTVAVALAINVSGFNAAAWCLPFSLSKQGAAQTPAPNSSARPVGTIKALNGKFITLTPDSGPDVTVLAQESTRLLRVTPGQRDLKDATPIQLQDLQVGDRILVRGRLSDDSKSDSKSVLASSIVVMKRTDVEAKQQREREDWQKRGVGGLVSTVDRDTGTITISTMVAGATKTIAVHSSKDTVLRRYAADSVKFDDAKPGTLDQIKTGDQLRARGTRSSDGSELTAEEIVSGSFRNIAGTIASLDSTAGTITVMDLITKKLVLVRVTSQSQLRKLPPEMAQRIAMRLRRAPGEAAAEGQPGATPAANDPNSASPQPVSRQRGEPGAGPPAQRTRNENLVMRSAPGKQDGAASQQPAQRSGFPGRPSGEGGAADLQQILSRMPASTLADLKKGDAVMIVSTQESSSGEVTAITLLGGVEPILASPNAGQAMNLSPWSLGQGGDAAPPGTP
jgi:hypothetical protein